MPLSRQFADDLALALRQRRIKQGIAMLDASENELRKIGPAWPNSARLLLLLAQWVDLGYRDYRFLDGLLEQFRNDGRKHLSIDDYLRLRMAEAFTSLASGESDASIQALELVLHTLKDLGEEADCALAHFWIGRAHRKRGEYEKSLEHFARSREMAQGQNDKMFTAVVQVQEAGCCFRRGLRAMPCRFSSVLKPFFGPPTTTSRWETSSRPAGVSSVAWASTRARWSISREPWNCTRGAIRTI